MFGKIEGQRLNLAKMYIANYCRALADQAGGVDVHHVVSTINREYKLVPQEEVEALAQDVTYFYNCLGNQQVTGIDRGSYWKWRAMSPFEAKADLNRELDALGAD
ncbi:hypothetical protein [Comamonas kerstersii]|uniref:hypothetical protein n=1 Tax=Comamonas kerstersii TaxID=225992 RepID=UPI001B332AD3|nr:hypothetical protein [Comamonas kerstersii]QTW19681.1 hypothetical protein H8N02_04285 [Comamonas kerstersii]